MKKNVVVLYIIDDDPLLVCADECYLPDFTAETIHSFCYLYSVNFPHRIIVKILRAESVFG